MVNNTTHLLKRASATSESLLQRQTIAISSYSPKQNTDLDTERASFDLSSLFVVVCEVVGREFVEDPLHSRPRGLQAARIPKIGNHSEIEHLMTNEITQEKKM